MKITREEGGKKLVELADFLDNEVDYEKFSMNAWASFCYDEIPKIFGFKETTVMDTTRECGTAACAAGWGTALNHGTYLSQDGRICIEDENGNELEGTPACMEAYGLLWSEVVGIFGSEVGMTAPTPSSLLPNQQLKTNVAKIVRAQGMAMIVEATKI